MKEWQRGARSSVSAEPSLKRHLLLAKVLPNYSLRFFGRSGINVSRQFFMV
jgi:hypothetical protein